MLPAVDRATVVRLRQEIVRDLAAVSALLDGLRARGAALGATNDPVLEGYAAVTLHQVYTGLETCFERICRALDGSVPGGADGHQALLRDMALELTEIRPAVLRPETEAGLVPLLRFRRFVRHSYAVSWDARRLSQVLGDALAVWPHVQSDVADFVDFLDAAAAELAR